MTTVGFLALCGTLTLAFGGCGGIVDKQAEEQFRQALGDTTVTVFLALVRAGEEQSYDRDAATAVAEFLTAEELAATVVSTVEVPISSRWGTNQSKMFRESAADFATYIQQNELETDYGLLAEYLIGGTGQVLGVHLYLLDDQGTVAYGFLLNSHHQEFRHVDPQTAGDCTTLVISKLRTDLVQDAETSAEP